MRTVGKLDLSNRSIADIVDTVRDTALQNNVDKKEAIRISFVLEETLLKYQEQLGEGQRVIFIQDKMRSRYRIRIRIPSLSFNPYEFGEGEEILQNLLTGQGVALQWSYRDGENTLAYSFKKKLKNSFLVQLGLSILAAAGLYLLCMLLPKQIGDFISISVVGPLYETFTGLISFISGPLVLLSVMWGVFSIGDVTVLSNVGKKMIKRFLLMMLLCAALTAVCMLPFYSISYSGKSGFAFDELYGMVLDIVPDNLIAPFLSGNTLQIIFIAVIIGIAMLLLSEKTTVAAKFVEQTNYIVQLIMETISKLIPAFVFMSIFQLLKSGGLDLLIGSYKILVTIVLSSLVVLLLYVIILAVHLKLPVRTLLPKLMPTFLIAITTASSSAAFGENMETCEKRLGIDKHIVNIGIPLGQTVFMPNTTILFSCLALYISEYYQVEMSLPWLFTLMLVSTILAIAAPPVPGGALACYALLAVQIGLPDESVAMFCALGVIPDFIATATNLSALQMELTELASRLGMLDTETLFAPASAVKQK